MPTFDLIAAACQSRSRTASAQALINLYPEQNADQTITLYGTPGRNLLAAIGNGPIRGMMADGNTLYVVSGTDVYSVSDALAATSLGTLRSGYGRVYFAANGVDLMLVDGVSGYRIVAGVLSEIADSDFPDGVTWCDCIDGFYIVGGDGSQKFYKSGLLDGSAWDALDFASAEGDPDALLRGIVSNREILLFGTRSLEFWTNTGAAGFPFERTGNAFVEQGCLARDSVAKLDSGVFWLGRSAEGQGVVWRLNGYTPVRISTHAEEYEISQWDDPTSAIAWTYVDGGHAFYVLTSPSGDISLCFDVASGRWHQRRSRDALNRLHRDRAACYVFWRGMHLVGDYENANVYELRQDVYTDNGDAIPRAIVGEHIRSGKRRFYGDVEVGIASGVGSIERSAIACAYPLDDDGLMAFLYGFGYAGPAIGNGQRMSFTTTNSGQIRVLASSGVRGAGRFQRSNRAMGFEASTIAVDTVAAGLALLINNYGGAVINAVSITSTAPGDLMQFEVGADGTVSAKLNGAPYDISGNWLIPLGQKTVGASDYFMPYLWINDSVAGKDVDIQLTTNAEDFTGTYSSGASDLCGNVIGEPYATYSEPVAVLSVSDDGGRTFHSSRSRGFGALGDYKERLVWHRNGSAFTRTFKLEITDAVSIAITGARIEFTE